MASQNWLRKIIAIGERFFDVQPVVMVNSSGDIIESGGSTDVSALNKESTQLELKTLLKGHICTDNSTTTPLIENAVFTGAFQDTLDFSEIIVSINTDKASATDGLVVQWSSDGTNVHEDDVFSIAANVGKTFSFPPNRRYFRVKYTNGGTAQTLFNLESSLKRNATKGSSHRLKDALNQQDDAIVTKTLIAGITTAGSGAIVNVKVNPSGALTVENTNSTTQRTPTKTTVTSSGTVAAGANKVTLLTSSDFAGTILDDVASPNTTYSFEVNCNDTLAAIAYTVTTGSIEILKIV